MKRAGEAGGGAAGEGNERRFQKIQRPLTPDGES